MYETKIFFYYSSTSVVGYRVGSSPVQPCLDCHAVIPGHCHHTAMSNGYLDTHHVNHPQTNILCRSCPNTHHTGGVKCKYTQPSPHRGSYRAKRTAGHLRISDIICIVTHTSPLKTNAHDSRFELSNLHQFLCMQSSNAEKVTVLGCRDYDLNTECKRRLFNYGKCT